MSELTKDELIVFGSESKLVQGKIGYYNQEDWPVVVAEINQYHECVHDPLRLAQLFAAAPDMLEALEQAVVSMLDSGYSINRVAVKAGLQAIAKAKGEKI